MNLAEPMESPMEEPSSARQTARPKNAGDVRLDAVQGKLRRIGGDVLSVRAGDDGCSLILRLCRRGVRLAGMIVLLVAASLQFPAVWGLCVGWMDSAMQGMAVMGGVVALPGILAVWGAHFRCRLSRTDNGFVFTKGRRQLALPVGCVLSVQAIGGPPDLKTAIGRGIRNGFGLFLSLGTGLGSVQNEAAIAPWIRIFIVRNGGVSSIDLRHLARQRRMAAHATAIAEFLDVPVERIRK
jgi:hypothetical protein